MVFSPVGYELMVYKGFYVILLVGLLTKNLKVSYLNEIWGFNTFCGERGRSKHVKNIIEFDLLLVYS